MNQNGIKRLQRYSLLFVCFLGVQLHAEEWGNLKGKFIWDGDLPKLESYKITSDVKCCGKEIPNESLIVDPETKGIKNILIYLRSKVPDIHPDYQKGSKAPVTLTMEKCRYHPRVFTLQLSQTLILKNKDECAHLPVVSPFANTGFGVILSKNQSFSHQFNRIQKRPVSAEDKIHHWMKSYILPVNHPYTSVTKTDGSFEIKNLPVGGLEFQLWHEKIGYLIPIKESERGRFKVTIKEDQTNDIGTVKVNSTLFKEKD